jgi:hypothetical protein
VLVEADATDPVTTGNALGAVRGILDTALRNDLKGDLAYLAGEAGPFEVRVHALYNPEGITQYNVVPGLLGVVLTMAMVIITALAITRERESGTMENLLSIPTRPLEVLIGKISPYIMVGCVQVCLILLAARFLFRVPLSGSLWLLCAAAMLFINANLAVGVTFSTLARNQRQAMQMAMFFFLPSILLSGFIFPFRGMPQWAQAIGTVLPPTHFLRIVRGGDAEGERRNSGGGGAAADRGLRGGGAGDRRGAVSEDAGLAEVGLGASLGGDLARGDHAVAGGRCALGDREPGGDQAGAAAGRDEERAALPGVEHGAGGHGGDHRGIGRG